KRNIMSTLDYFINHGIEKGIREGMQKGVQAGKEQSQKEVLFNQLPALFKLIVNFPQLSNKMLSELSGHFSTSEVKKIKEILDSGKKLVMRKELKTLCFNKLTMTKEDNARLREIISEYFELRKN
ncbi:MAG: hypothetical protein AAFO94_22175, partial [Bacteroidota bacterium]